MRRGALAYARARAQATLLLALAGVVLVSTVALIGLDAWHRAPEQEAVEHALRAGPVTAAALRIDVPADRAAELDARIRAARVSFERSLQTDGFPVTVHGSTHQLVARADPHLPSRSELVAGAWPTTSGSDGAEIHAAFQAEAATQLGVSVGDRLRVRSDTGDLEVVVDAMWRPKDATAIAWFADPATGSGTGPDGRGPLVVSAADLARLPAAADASYVLTPRRPGDLARAARDLRRLVSSIEDSDVPATMSGELPERLDAVARARAASRGLLAVAYSLLSLTALAAGRQVVNLLVEARRAETRLVRSRGGTLGAMTAGATVEATVAAAAGAVAGTAGAIWAFQRVGRAPDVSLAVVLAVACVTVTGVLAATATWSAAGRPAVRGDEPRGPKGAGAPLLVLVLVATVIPVGQFLALDGPLSRSATGGTKVDPITSLAPAAALAAMTLVASVGALPLLRLLEGRTRLRTGLVPALPTRQLARRLSTFGVAIVLVSIAVGFSTLVASVQGTQSALEADAARVRAGGDVRLDLAAEPTAGAGVESTTAPLMGLGDRTAAVVVAPARVDQDEVSFLAAPSAVKDVVEPHLRTESAGLTRMLHPRPPGVPIESGTYSVEVAVTGSAITGDVESTVWLVDGAGQVAARPMAAISPAEARQGPVARAVTVPANPRGWRFLAVDAAATGVTGGATIGYSGLPGAERYDAVMEYDRSTARAVAGSTVRRLPVVITPALASLIDAGVGDTFDVSLPEAGFKGTVSVAGVTDAIPGMTAARGIVADLPTLTSYALATGTSVPAARSVWIATAQAEQVRRQAASAGVVQVTATTAATGPVSRIVGSALRAWWWAAGSVVVLAAVATAAMTASLRRTRQPELQVLRALGLSPAQQGRLRSYEIGGAVLLGGVAGLIAGAVTVLLTAKILADSATPGRPASADPTLSFSLGGFLGLLALLTIGVVATAVAYTRRVSRDAALPGGRGDAG